MVLSEVDWDIIWADVSWVRECLDHIRLEEHQVWVGSSKQRATTAHTGCVR